MTERIRLGRINGRIVYLSKHKWDCDWYWGFGYLGNAHWHFPLSSLLGSETDVAKIFESPTLSQNDWWIIRDLAVQAYALKKAAEVYRYGGYQTTVKGVTDILQSKDKAATLNADLEIVLELLWAHVNEKVQL